jgi:ComF family protein
MWVTAWENQRIQRLAKTEILLRLFKADASAALAPILKGVSDRVLPQSCFFCGDGGAETVCPPCAAELPRLAEQVCPRCQLAAANGEVCGRCLKKPPVWEHLVAQWQYEFPLDRAMISAKYHHAFAIYRWAATQRGDWPFAAKATLIPVPLAEFRLQSRGYNQAQLIAEEMAKRFGLKVDADAVVRIRETDIQQRLNWSERRQNVRNAFVATRPFTDESVVLIDDVLTTGATLNELARAVLSAGAARVDAFVLARVLPIRRRDRVIKFGQARA